MFKIEFLEVVQCNAFVVTLELVELLRFNGELAEICRFLSVKFIFIPVMMQI